MEKNKKPDKRSTDWLKTLKKMKVDTRRLSENKTLERITPNWFQRNFKFS